ncbi:MAG: dehydrogenase [Gorillibacterium sp.]|nr:dehydrogenase [Gorillibacterium sp.]
MKVDNGKHDNPLPSVRQVRRACGRELYRTAKRLGKRITPEKMEQAVTCYFKKVVLHLPYIVKNAGNKKLLADWFDEQMAIEVAEMWEVEPKAVAVAFRQALGG